jgi:hypothetical protein
MRTERYASDDLGAEPCTCPVVDGTRAGGTRGCPEPHAVVAGEVARGLDGGDGVVRGEREFGVLERHVLDVRAEVAGEGDRRVDGGAHGRRDVVAEVLLWAPDAHAAERPAVLERTAGRAEPVDLEVGRGRVARVAAGDHFEERRRVVHRTGADSELVERRGDRHQSRTADAAEGGADRDHAARGRRLAESAPGVAA